MHFKQFYSSLKTNLSRISIKVKLGFVLVFCAVFTPIFLVAYTAALEEKALLVKQRLATQHSLEIKSQFITNLFESTVRNVIFLTQVPTVRIFSSIDFLGERKDLENRMLDQFSKINSTEVFIDFLKSNLLYQQLTYLDNSGVERLKINQQQGEISLIDDELLVERADQTFFNKTMALSKGEVYISAIEFFDDQETDKNNLYPVIRLATQVYDKQEQLQGVLVISVSGQILLNVTQDSMLKNGLTFVIDSDGYYLLHPDVSKSWSKLRGNQYTLQSDLPGFNNKLNHLLSNSPQHSLIQDNEVFFSPVITKFNKIKTWYIVKIIPSSLFLESTQLYFFIVLVISILGIFISLYLGYSLAKFWLLNPLKELIKMTNSIANGDYVTLALEDNQKNEIGELFLSFNQMSIALSKAQQERKKHIDSLNKEISERKKIESDLLLHRTFFEQSTDAMFIADDNSLITYVNPAFSEITGYSSKEVIGNKTELLHSTKNDEKFYQKIWGKVNKNGYWQGEIWERRKGKENFPALQTINAIKNENGETHYVSIFKDMSNLKEKENELWKLAHFDQLTNLANRKLLEERINSALSEAYRHKSIGALIFMDLDNFKHINDSLGHNHGDLVLQEIARRLKAVTRSNDTVARLGGDEYIILLTNLSDNIKEASNITTSVIEKMFQSLKTPCVIKGHELHVTTSMGVVLFPEDGNTPQKLLKQADTAMYSAKDKGKNTFSFYHSDMQAMADKRLLIERELRQALKNDDLVVYYQAQYNQAHELIGFEALVRWIHPERGLISPKDFIPMAEESDLIMEIGDKIFSDVCDFLVMAEKSGQIIPQISINISPRQFSSLNFIDWINSFIDKTGANPSQIMLEITEGIIIRNLERTISNMQILKNSGFRFSIDDFGTGYSSLSYLKQLPIDELKIDRSFICDIGSTQDSVVIVDTIVSMARHLNLELIAEGVETKEQLDYLVKCGCNGFQGYYFGLPVPGEQIKLEKQTKTS
ncbi:MAG: EAL domain-containing protein [Gammaproteobacteria bacterium]|nr:EAL domain-containing protein [Gammaproteobacteria bacterium]